MSDAVLGPEHQANLFRYKTFRIPGACCRWDLTGRPTAPMQTFGHDAAVTKVLHVRENVLAVAGAGGSITLWDPRRSSYPIRIVKLGTGYVPQQLFNLFATTAASCLC